MKLLVLDNYDSFTYNLVHLVEKVSDAKISVVRNDKIALAEIANFDKILLSPGPGLPKDAGIMPQLLKTYCSSKSILGVCLGMQAIAENFGGSLHNLETVYHGIATSVNIIETDSLFINCPPTFKVGRYHSWVVDPSSLPDTLKVTAVDEQNNIMALEHKTLDVKGVQFHPESILSEYGELMISNWLKA
ncbi:MAG: aminodeoxychorismate/anthranilate synthase component II [Bacteroidota bacterium]|nr:aminodeoxychorismate/anthranilate synthase component II [Bacteroidota bacterium]